MILIGMGANLPSRFGSPIETLNEVFKTLGKIGVNPKKISPIYRTEPIDVPDEQPWYHNVVISVETDLTPDGLLSALNVVEIEFGRVRSVKNAARVIDLDIIAYNDETLTSDRLTVPHSAMCERAFVLYPLRDIAPNWMHPVSGKTIDALIEALPVEQRFEVV